MLKKWSTLAVLSLLVLSVCGGPFRRPVFLFEDFSGYPPESEQQVPDGYVRLRGNVLSSETQEFDYGLWETDNIVRWAIRRKSSTYNQRRLVYTGFNDIDPSVWSNYTVYTTFETPVRSASCSVHLHARLQGNSADELGYSANLVGSATSELLPNRLLLRKNNFTHTITNLENQADILIAYTEDSFELAADTLYTLKFAVEGNLLSAWFYEGTNLLDPDALKLSVSAVDTEYQTGTAGFGLRVPNTNTYAYFYNLKVEGPLPEGTMLIVK